LDELYPYPIFLKLVGKKCIIAGGGAVALRKVKELMESGADITVIDDKPINGISELFLQKQISLLKRKFLPEDTEGAFIVIAATNDNETNKEIAAVSRKNGAIVNVVDKPENCDFISGAIVKRGPLRIAVSTSGKNPGFSVKIKKELENLYGDDYGEYIKFTGEIRKYILSLDNIDHKIKMKVFEKLAGEEYFRIYKNFGKEKIWEDLKKIISF
jgi:precorrin-2 dehydrogenase / sirohydrochlorin ferrochelatase